MSWSAVFRFFGMILRPSRPLVASALAITAFGGYLAWVAPGDYEQVFGIALLFQMFSAATGFLGHARRGHFDPILTAPTHRVVVGLAHSALSAAPGVALWIVLTAIDVIVHPGQRSPGFALPSGVALLYVSAVGWTVALNLARHATGALWILLFFLLAAGHRMHALQEVFLTDTATWTNVWKVAGSAMVCPIFLAAYPLAPGLWSVSLVLLAALGVLAIGILRIVVFEAALDEPS
jgi:hypothetical protein